MTHRLFRRPGWLITVALAALLLAPAAHADCSEGEMTAVFLVSGIYPGTDLAIEVLEVAPVGPETNPTEAEMIAALEDAIADPWQYYVQHHVVGPWHLFWCEPADFGSCGIVDGRDGRVVFGGTVVWMGFGEVCVPAESSHEWNELAGEPAAPPAEVAIIPSLFWWDGYGSEEGITAAAVDLLRTTDVLHSFADCDAYSVTSFIYTPTVGMTDPNVAQSVIIVSGRCGPPWNGEPVTVEQSTWSGVRALFH